MRKEKPSPEQHALTVINLQPPFGDILQPTIIKSLPYYRGFDPKKIVTVIIDGKRKNLMTVDYYHERLSAQEIIALYSDEPPEKGDSPFVGLPLPQTPVVDVIGTNWFEAHRALLPVPSILYKVNDTCLAFPDPTNANKNYLIGAMESQAVIEQEDLFSSMKPEMIKNIARLPIMEIERQAHIIISQATKNNILLKSDEMLDLVITPRGTWSVVINGLNAIEANSMHPNIEIYNYNVGIRMFMSHIQTVYYEAQRFLRAQQ